jgi:hypothetical protein
VTRLAGQAGTGTAVLTSINDVSSTAASPTSRTRSGCQRRIAYAAELGDAVQPGGKDLPERLAWQAGKAAEEHRQHDRRAERTGSVVNAGRRDQVAEQHRRYRRGADARRRCRAHGRSHRHGDSFHS